MAWRRHQDLSSARWPTLHRWLWFFGIALAIWGLQQDPANTYSNKISGPFLDPNLYAASLNLFWLPLAALFLGQMSASKWRSAAALAGLGLIATAFFLAASRGATLAALLLSPLIVWHCRATPGFTRRAMQLASVTLAAYAYARWASPHDVAARLIVTLSDGDNSRLMLWKATFDLILNAPWHGIGLGGFRSAYPLTRMPEENLTAGIWSHNDYLQLWLEGGIITLLFVLVFFGVFAWLAFDALRRRADAAAIEQLGLACGALALFIHAGVNFILYFAFVNVFLGLYLARALQLRGSTPDKGWVLPVRPIVAQTAVLALAFAGLLNLAGHLGMQLFLGGSQYGMQAIRALGHEPNTYEIAHRLARLLPDAPAPRYVMAKQMENVLNAGGTGKAEMDREAFELATEHYEAARRLAPCHVSFGIAEADFLRRHARHGAPGQAQRLAIEVLRDNLACNPRHGLSLYLLARQLAQQGDENGARTLLVFGIRNALFGPERLVLIAALRGLDHPAFAAPYEQLATEMGQRLFYYENNPTAREKTDFWQEKQRQLARLRAEALATEARLAKPPASAARP
ncbi:O-antigen ligase family protein [Sulfuritortus calidifontis]|uniref:O-antigen ligase family protein n=1 Tax=Sulfuritortus calidifontis TaxID=1914471 RepID=UPI0014050DB6|nr:O-antigen ligase family protein [Sulfuritortus calidifontis]